MALGRRKNSERLGVTLLVALLLALGITMFWRSGPAHGFSLESQPGDEEPEGKDFPELGSAAESPARRVALVPDAEPEQTKPAKGLLPNPLSKDELDRIPGLLLDLHDDDISQNAGKAVRALLRMGPATAPFLRFS